MRYPQPHSLTEESREICQSDLVWFNEGSCVGFVEEVIELEAECKNRGLDTPAVVFTNLHPFEANSLRHPQRIGYLPSIRLVVDQADLKQEGVGLLSSHERAEFGWAAAEAKSKVSVLHCALPFCVSAMKAPFREQEDWHFDFVDEEGKITESVVIPFRPGTRTVNPGKLADDHLPVDFHRHRHRGVVLLVVSLREVSQSPRSPFRTAKARAKTLHHPPLPRRRAQSCPVAALHHLTDFSHARDHRDG